MIGKIKGIICSYFCMAILVTIISLLFSHYEHKTETHMVRGILWPVTLFYYGAGLGAYAAENKCLWIPFFKCRY